MSAPRITLLIHDLPSGLEPELDYDVLAALLRAPPRRAMGSGAEETTLVYELSGEELTALLGSAGPPTGPAPRPQD